MSVTSIFLRMCLKVSIVETDNISSTSLISFLMLVVTYCRPLQATVGVLLSRRGLIFVVTYFHESYAVVLSS